MGSLANMSKTIRRHYKKDSRFVMDLYTLTYDNHESLDSMMETRRTDREEIRRRLAMGPEPECFPSTRASKKQSLQSRLQNGMNLQICFMNDNISDGESPTLELTTQDNLNVNIRADTLSSTATHSSEVVNIDSMLHNIAGIDETHDNDRTVSLAMAHPAAPKTEQDFFACQARLQVEARLALAQAKQMAHMQMELERQKQVSSPITDVIRNALTTVGTASPERHRRLSRRLLTSMTVAQLQVVVCRLHTQVELFNEQLVGLLMNRDELHMSQDSMLVDIEDLTRYLGAKEEDTNYSSSHVKSKSQKKSTAERNSRLQRISHIIRK